MTNRSQIVREQWNEFRTSSSVRGLKRTVTSPTKGLRVFWILFLLTSLAIMTAQMTNVLITYFKLKDATAMRTQRKPNSPSIFPSMTLCRKHPYKPADQVARIMRSHNASVTSPESLNLIIRQRLLEVMLQGEINGTDFDILFLQIIGVYDTASGFNAQVPRAAISEISMSIAEFAIVVTATYRNGSNVLLVVNPAILQPFVNRNVTLHRFVHPILYAKSFYHSLYLQCQTVSLNISDHDLRELQSIEVITWNPQTKFTTESNSSFSRAYTTQGFMFGSGTMVALHDRETSGMLAIDESGILLQSAMLNVLHFDTTITHSLDCVSEPLKQGKEGGFSYGVRHCKELELERQLRQKCNCTMNPVAWDEPHCLYLTPEREIEAAQRFLRCWHEIKLPADVCNKPACYHVQYDAKVMTSPWNINDFQWKWLWEILAGSTLGYLLDSKLPVENRTAAIRAPLFDFNDLKESLASVKIARKSSATTHMTEVELTSLGTMFSSLGGGLSLYMGVTLTLCAEFMEFMIRLYWRMRGRHGVVCDQPAADKSEVQQIDMQMQLSSVAKA